MNRVIIALSLLMITGCSSKVGKVPSKQTLFAACPRGDFAATNSPRTDCILEATAICKDTYRISSLSPDASSDLIAFSFQCGDSSY